jgi:disulfide bond formation protein DsbB
MYIFNPMTKKILSILSNDLKFNALMIIICLVSLITSFYLEYVLNFFPCTLCIIQRICIVLILITLISRHFFFNEKKFFLLFPLFFSLTGIATSIRQIYFQNNPTDKILTCEPSFFEMFINLSFFDFINKVFQADGTCSKNAITFFGLDIPEWSTIIFFFIILILVIRLVYEFQDS